MSKEFRIYKPQRDKKGAASKWQCSTKIKKVKGKSYPELMLFLEIAPQTGVDKDGNATFDWGNDGEAIIVKLGTADIGEFLLVADGKKEAVGPPKASDRKVELGLFHQTPKGNTTIRFYIRNKMFYIAVSRQRDGKVIRHGHAVTPAEATVLSVLLKDFLVKCYDWNIKS